MPILSLDPLPPGTGTVALVILGLAALYVAECLIWPYGRCTRCEGGGIHMGPDGQHWRDCHACGGSGKRHRPGRRLMNLLRRRR
ncbi:hypothetical protein [Micromonospora okii]|uniref:hypothetical protein n=1 Tax=Micromonospora okii TaxID=1182970 RepID=UPI001E350BE1|nr:hypothetical protein [Micromonospora okii]